MTHEKDDKQAFQVAINNLAILKLNYLVGKGGRDSIVSGVK